MSNAALYQKDSIWFYKNGISNAIKTFPQGMFRVSMLDNGIGIFGANNTFSLFEVEGDYVDVTKIEKSEVENDFYTSIDEFLTETKGLYSSSSAVSIIDENGDAITRQNPTFVNNDSIYASDIDITNSDIGTFTGSITDFFDDLKTVNTSVAGSAHYIKFWFKRTVSGHTVGIGCDNILKSFDGSATIKLLGSGEVVRYQNTFDDLDGNSYIFKCGPQQFNGVIIEFDTANEVCLSNVTLQKSIEANTTIHGKRPDGTIGVVEVSGSNNLKIAVAEIVSDAFGRQKVSLPTSQLDSVIEHDMSDVFVESLIGGGGTYAFDTVNNLVNMGVTTTGDYVVLETIANGKYQPGKALEFVASMLMTDDANAVKRIGYCTVRGIGITATNQIQNGIYFENNNGVFSWNVVKNGTVTETVLQANWNIDKLDGTGASLFNFESDYVQLPYIDLQFLAAGTVRVGFNINGKDIITHSFYHANTSDFTSTYMHTANLPFHCSITSTNGAASMKAIGYSISSGGGFDALGKLNFIDVEDLTISSGDTELLVGMRLKDEYYNSFVKLLSTSVMTTGSSNFKWMLLLDPTYEGTVTWIDEPGSAIQYARGVGNEILTEANRGFKIVGGQASDRTRNSAGEIDNSLRLAKKLDGSFIEIWLAVSVFTSDDFYGIINYKDLF